MSSRVCTRIRPADQADVGDLVELVGSIDAGSGTFSGRALLDADVAHLRRRLAEILDEGVRILLVAVDEQTDSIVGLLVAKLDEIGTIDLTPTLHVTHL